jgi:hypothetical protein
MPQTQLPRRIHACDGYWPSASSPRRPRTWPTDGPAVPSAPWSRPGPPPAWWVAEPADEQPGLPCRDELCAALRIGFRHPSIMQAAVSHQARPGRRPTPGRPHTAPPRAATCLVRADYLRGQHLGSLRSSSGPPGSQTMRTQATCMFPPVKPGRQRRVPPSRTRSAPGEPNEPGFERGGARCR